MHDEDGLADTIALGWSWESDTCSTRYIDSNDVRKEENAELAAVATAGVETPSLANVASVI